MSSCGFVRVEILFVVVVYSVILRIQLVPTVMAHFFFSFYMVRTMLLLGTICPAE
jgi:hypothetical protein